MAGRAEVDEVARLLEPPGVGAAAGPDVGLDGRVRTREVQHQAGRDRGDVQRRVVADTVVEVVLEVVGLGAGEVLPDAGEVVGLAVRPEGADVDAELAVPLRGVAARGVAVLRRGRQGRDGQKPREGQKYACGL